MPSSLELTLVLAATRDMGIGRNGTLPWTGLKKEMAYFARITKRVPVPLQSPPAQNAVIMGRKTWDSIPQRFRPLKDRLNVVVSRSQMSGTAQVPDDVAKEPVRVGSLEQAVDYLQGRPAGTLGRVFVIGGAQIYDAALKLKETRRILLTRVVTDFECDVFFPLKLGEDSDVKEEAAGWLRSKKAEQDAWAGEEVAEGVQEENGAKYEFQMWERTD